MAIRITGKDDMLLVKMKMHQLTYQSLSSSLFRYKLIRVEDMLYIYIGA